MAHIIVEQFNRALYYFYNLHATYIKISVIPNAVCIFKFKHW